eukprot:TRINITY_DN18233_c0_g1_i1.p1 TRINITY_DN18233_c0_g1~~TRINITY_DN18233_c0_g1_i1.p1  ORF type:complete len:856 (+),score=123.70 TRINITY_DN18233_c0_g1_i1:45-2570(+)
MAFRSSFRVEASVKTVYTGAGFHVMEKRGIMASAANDGVVLMDYDTGGKLAEANMQDGEPVSVTASSGCEEWLYTGSKSLMGALWRVTESESLDISVSLHRKWLPSKHPVSAACFSLESKTLATGSTDGAIRLWGVQTHSETKTIQNDGGIILHMKYSEVSGHEFLFVSCIKGMVAVFDSNGVRVACIEDHSGPVETFEFFYNGAMLVTGGRDGKINIYRLSATESLTDDKKRRRMSKNSKSALQLNATSTHSFGVLEEVSSMVRLSNRLKFQSSWSLLTDDDPDREILIVGGATGKVTYLYVERTGRGKKCKKDFANKTIRDKVRLNRMVSVPSKGEVIIVNEDHDISFHNTEMETSREIVGNIDQVLDVRYSQGSEICTASNSSSLRIFSVDSPFCTSLLGHDDVILTLAITKCRKYLASGSKDRTIRIWDASTHECIAILKGHTGDVTGLSFGSPVEGSSAPPLLGSVAADLTLMVWNVRDLFSGSRLKRLREEQHLLPTEPVTIQSSPNMTMARAHEQDICSIAFNPTADLIATSSKDKTGRVWSLFGKSVKLTCVLKGHRRRVHSIVFSPHEKILATCSGDNTIKLWGAHSGECLKTFQGHSNPVLVVQFINKGTQLISGSSDGVIIIWGIKHQSNLATITAHKDRIWSIDLNPTETGFATCGSDGVVNIWKDYTDDDLVEKQLKNAINIKEKQLLQDKMRKEEYTELIELCLKLNHPRDLRDALFRMQKGDCAEMHLCQAIAGLDDDLLARLFKFTQQWMLNSLTADIAAVVVKATVTSLHPTRLAANGNLRAILSSLIAYSSRHHDRLRLQQQQLHLIPMFCGTEPPIPEVSLL